MITEESCLYYREPQSKDCSAGYTPDTCRYKRSDAAPAMDCERCPMHHTTSCGECDLGMTTCYRCYFFIEGSGKVPAEDPARVANLCGARVQVKDRGSFTLAFMARDFSDAVRMIQSWAAGAFGTSEVLGDVNVSWGTSVLVLHFEKENQNE